MKTPKNVDPVPPSDAAPAAAPEAGASAPPPPTPMPESELAVAKATVATLEDRVRRQQAEFVNDMRRIQRQADERVKFAVQPLVSELLGVIDALYGAIEGLKDGEHERRVAQGLKLVEKELFDVLGRQGVARIDAMGKPFDPAVHEAVVEIDSPSPPHTVLQVTRPGFTLNGRLIRAAHVIVSKRKPEPAPEAPLPPHGEA